MLAEGVLHYFKAQIPEAYDRIRRAYGLAIALRNNSAFPSCAAWMAHIEFNACKYDDMVKHLGEALATAQLKDHQAIARASLVLATAYHIAGDFQGSRPWYEKARLNAAAEGDDATVSATLHNMASIRASNVRLEDTFGGDPISETQRVTLEASSSLTYDYAIGHRGLDFLTQMLGGLISTIDKRYDEALQTFGKIVIDDMPGRLRSVVFVDQAWCWAQKRELEKSLTLVDDCFKSLSLVEDDDDIAYINARLHQVLVACDRQEEAQQYKLVANAALFRHRKFQQKLLSKILAINMDAQNKNPA